MAGRTACNGSASSKATPAKGVKRAAEQAESASSASKAPRKVVRCPSIVEPKSCATPQRQRVAATAVSSAASPRPTEHVDRQVLVAASPSVPQLSPALQDLDAVVISLERRPDRMEGCRARLQAYCPWLKHSLFPATDGKQTVMSESDVVTSWNTAQNVVYQKRRAIRKGWDDLDSYHVRDLPMSAGERGCAVSHIRAWQLCLERAGDTDRPLLVLEDDAAPTPDFTASLERAMATTPADAHVLYLGYSQAAEWRREVSDKVVESEYVWTTVGYIVWPAGARMLLSRLPVDGPVDNWMAQAAADDHIKAYAVRPKIIRQADEWNTNSDVAHSDEHYWGADSDIKHSDDFYWDSESKHPAVSSAAPSGADGGASTTAGTTALGGGRFLAGSSAFWDIGIDSDSDDNDTAPQR